MDELTRKLAAGEYERVPYNGTCKKHLRLKRDQAALLELNEKETIILNGERLIIQVDGVWVTGNAEDDCTEPLNDSPEEQNDKTLL
jgi:hypothetical protein